MTIETLIKKTGLHDAKLAVMLGVAPISVYRWREGLSVPVTHLREQLCKLAGVEESAVDWTKDGAA